MWGGEMGWSRARLTQEPGSDEIDETLASAGLLHHQQTPPPLHHMTDGVLLIFAEIGRWVLCAQPEQLKGAWSDIGHAPLTWPIPRNGSPG